MAQSKILLLDTKNRNILEVSLKKSKFTVTCGESATQALDVVETFAPDLIISETHLNDKDGFWFVEQLKNKTGELPVPVLFLTKENKVEEKIRGLELGVEDYLVKPIYLREVVARVKRLLERSTEGLAPSSKQDDSNLFQGDLEDMGVVDLLQTMEFGNKTAIIHISHTSRDAQVFIENGRVVHSVAGSLVGERAMYKLMQWVEGKFRIDFRKSIQVQHTINTSTQGLIMEGVRRIDELERLKEQLPPFNARLVIDSEVILEDHPDRFPAKIENILADFDGRREIEAVVEALPYDDLESLEVISKLYFQGFLVEAPDELEEEYPATPSDQKHETSRFGATGDILDLDKLDLGVATSVENIKKKAKGTSDASSSSYRSALPTAPVFDSLPGFDLAPPSERVVKVSTKESIASKSRAGNSARRPNTGLQSESFHPSRSEFRVSRDIEPSVKMAPPIVPPAAQEFASPVGRKAPESESPKMASPQKGIGQSEKEIAGRLKRNKPAPKEPTKPVFNKAKDPFPMDDPVEVIGNVVSMPSVRFAQENAPNLSQDMPLSDHRRGSLKKPVWVLVAGGSILLVFALIVGWLLFRPEPRTAGFWFEEAQQQYNEMEYGQALLSVRKALQLSPSHIEARILSADIEMARGRRQEATIQYGSIVATNPLLFDLRFKYTKLLFEQRTLPAAERSLVEIENLLIDISPLRDRRLYEQALSLQIDILLFLGNLEKAANTVDRLEDFNPLDESVPTLRSRIEKMQQQIRQRAEPAVQEVARKVQVVPKKQVVKASPPASRKKRVKKVSKPKLTAAQIAAQKLVQEANAHHTKGLELYRKGYLKSAGRSFKQALDLQPTNTVFLLDLGKVYLELGEDNEALGQFKKAVELEPNNAEIYINLGSIYRLMGNQQESLSAYRKFVELAPSNSADAKEVRKILEKEGIKVP